MSLRKMIVTTAIALIASLGTGMSSLNIAHAEQPIHVYSELARTASVRISPNGNKVAMLSPYKGAKGIFIYDLNNPNSKTKVLPTPEGAIVKTISWGSNDHITMLATFNRRGQGKMRKFGSRFSRWVSTNVDTGKSTILMNDKIYEKGKKSIIEGQRARASGGQYSNRLQNDHNHILMTTAEYTGKPFVKLLKVNLDTGKSGLVKSFPIQTQNIILDSTGDNILARSEYNNRSGKYEAYAVTGNGEVSVYTQKFDTKKNPTIRLLHVLPESGKLLFVETEQPQLTLFTIDPTTKTKSPYTLSVPVPSGYEYGPLFDPFTDELIGVSYTTDTEQRVYTAEPYKSWHTKAKKAFPGQDVYILSRTKDNSAVTLFVSGANNPGEYYLFEPRAGRASSLGKTYPEINQSDIGRTKRVDFTARDGLKIPAYLTLPPGVSSGNTALPLVVLPHGGPVGPRDTANFDFWTQFIASRGYAVFRPQFRGSGGFGYTFTEAGYGEFGDGMLTDTIDGIKSLISNGQINKDKICVTGASYGGYQALALPFVEPEMFKCAISVNGVSDINAILKFEVARGGRNGGPIKFWNRVIGDYYDDRDMMKKQSPANNIEKIKAEILLVHGEDDLTVPYEQSKIMAKALKSVGKSDNIVMLPNDDHNLSHAQSRQTLLELSEKLFAKHLK